LGLRTGVTPNGRRTTAGTAIDATTAGITGIELTATSAKILSGYTGTVVQNIDFGTRKVFIEKPLTLVEDCLMGAVECRFAGSLDTLRYNTINGTGPYARINMGNLHPLIEGPVRLIEGNRLLNPAVDAIAASGSLLTGGQIIRGNYIAPLYNLVETPAAWNAGRTYTELDVVLNGSSVPYRSLINDNIGNPVPASGAGDAFWENYDSSGSGPHGDAITVKEAPGDGILIERNLIDWTRDTDGALGLGPVLAQGVNNHSRIDTGNSGSAGKTVNAVTWRDNMLWYGTDTSNKPVQIEPRLATFNGPISFIGNFMMPNSAGQYASDTGIINVWTGNVDAMTGATLTI
jgi:hypothetical protein